MAQPRAISVRLPDPLLNRVDAAAAAAGVTRSTAIRDAAAAWAEGVAAALPAFTDDEAAQAGRYAAALDGRRKGDAA